MKKRILSGMRPTGKLHLGNYLGVLSNWLKLQEEYECYFEVADWHALTTDFEHTEGLTENVLDMVADWLAAGIDHKIIIPECISALRKDNFVRTAIFQFFYRFFHVFRCKKLAVFNIDHFAGFCCGNQ